MTEAKGQGPASNNYGEPIGTQIRNGAPKDGTILANIRYQRGQVLYDVIVGAALAAHGREPLHISTEQPGEYILYAVPPFTEKSTAQQVGKAIERGLSSGQKREPSGPLLASEMDTFTVFPD